MLRKALVPVFCGILPGLTATAADPVFVRYKVTGEAPFDLLGRSVAPLGDVDGDAVPDFAAGAPEWTGMPDPAGRIVVVSGRDGRIVRTLRNETGAANFGAHVASAGDLDADGAQDILLTAHGLVEVRSGRTGELLLRIEEAGEEPTKALGIGDADGDGVPDLAVSYRDFPISRIAVRSGQTGNALWGAEGRLDEFAWSFAALGDADDDGSPDLAIGEPALGRASEPGSIRVLRGKDGTTIYSVESIPAGKSFGFSLAMLSDVDGDGVRELAVGSDSFGLFDQERLGRVDVVSGRTGSPPVWNRTGGDFDRTSRGSAFLGDRFGAQVGNAGDADGDGADDLLVWAPRNSQAMNGPVDDSRVHLHSGRTGALLAVYEAEEREAHFGWGLQRLGDVDGDGRSEFLVSAEVWSGRAEGGPASLESAGRVYIMSYLTSGTAFVRGDANLDRRVDVSDASALARGLMAGDSLPCEEAADVDRNGRNDMTDVVNILLYLFSDEVPAPDAPFPECGRFETFRDRLPCERSSCP